MGRLLEALQTLGAARQRDGSLVIDLAHLELTSLFGGALAGSAACTITGDALAFKTPLELAACGRLWLPDILDDDALVQAIFDAHGELRGRVNEAFATLRRLGFKARLQAPEPKARGSLVVDGVAVVVVIDTSGDLVVESVDGRALAGDQRRSLAAPEEATASEAAALVNDVVRASQRRAAAVPQMSQDELDELQAALSDDDDMLSSSEEAEPTAAGVEMPMRNSARQRNVVSGFDDGGTLQLPVSPGGEFTQELAPDDSDVGTLKVRFDADDVKGALAGRPAAAAKAPKEQSLLDEFDDELPEPPPTMTSAAPTATRVLDVDFDSGEADSFADSPEPTATRPHVSAATLAVATRQLRDVDDEENDLLAALGDDSAEGALAPPLTDHAFAGFPGVDDDGPGFVGGATSVNAADSAIPSAPPTAAAMPPPSPRQTSTPTRPATVAEPDHSTSFDDDFDDGKTRALVVDEALLARLKLGDAQGEAPSSSLSARAAPPAVPSVRAGFAVDDLPRGAELELDLDLDLDALEAPPIGASEEAEPTPASESVDAAPAVNDDLDGDLASLLDDEPIVDPLPPAPVLQVQPLIDDGVDALDDSVLDALLAREHQLGRELDEVRAQISALRSRLEVTDHANAARRSQAPTVMPTRRPTPSSAASSSSSSSSSVSRPRPAARSEQQGEAANQFAVVGASADHSAEADTNAARGIASLPSMKSIDVHEILPAHKNDLLDALDDDSFDDSPAGDAPASPSGDDDDIVSLAALQGALKEMGVDLESGQTQVAAEAMPFALPNDDDGDVFGSNVAGAFEQKTPDPAQSELSHEATRVRQARPASIGIVVEDERARLRLRKHLIDRFAELFEAEDCAAAVKLKALAHLDAIVFVRPSDNEPTRAGFARLNSLPRRPRVLVISSNDAFDDLDAVDLRLPLGQKASEVARQVLEGLERLGIQASPSA